MNTYSSIDSAINTIKQKTGQPCDYVSLVALFNSHQISVYLTYNSGYVCRVSYSDDERTDGHIISIKQPIAPIKLHPTNSDLADLIRGTLQSIQRADVRDTNNTACLFYTENPESINNCMPEDLEDLNHNYPPRTLINITRRDLVIDAASIESYSEKITGTSIAAKYAELEKEHEKLKADSKKLNEDLAELSSKKAIKKTGVSQAKVDAKLAAATLADYLWRKDTDQKIKIKDMATTVLIDLKQTSHIDQLPENPESLKKWIEEIAPPYAREAGRPTEK